MRLGGVHLVVMVLALAGVLGACDSAPPRPTYADIRFTGAPPIRLAVGGIDVSSTFKVSIAPPHVEHLFPVTPAHALENWAHDRLIAAGGAARARFVIIDASVVETELKKGNEGISGVFTKEPAQRYDATLEARLEIVENGLPVREVTVTATRTQTVLEGITPNEREQAWYDMTKAAMADFDRQISSEISVRFGGYFR